MTNGAVIGVTDAWIMSDSFVGFYSGEPLRRVAIARSYITKIQVRGDATPRAVRIAGKVYLGVVLALGINLAVFTVLYFSAR